MLPHLTSMTTGKGNPIMCLEKREVNYEDFVSQVPLMAKLNLIYFLYTNTPYLSIQKGTKIYYN